MSGPQRFLLSLFLTALPLGACNFKDVKDDEADDTVTIDPNTPVSFEEIQTNILEPSCISCHSAGGGNQAGVNLETYATVKTHIAAIKSSTVDSRRMPKGDSLSNNNIALLKAWIEQGAPE